MKVIIQCLQWMVVATKVVLAEYFLDSGNCHAEVIFCSHVVCNFIYMLSIIGCCLKCHLNVEVL